VTPISWSRYFFDIEYLRNDTRQSHSYYRTSIGSRICALSNGDISSDLGGPPNPVFKVMAFLKSNIWKKRRVLKQSYYFTLIGNYT